MAAVLEFIESKWGKDGREFQYVIYTRGRDFRIPASRSQPLCAEETPGSAGHQISGTLRAPMLNKTLHRYMLQHAHPIEELAPIGLGKARR